MPVQPPPSTQSVFGTRPSHDALRLTRHAWKRVAQRGLPTELIDIVIRHADREEDAGDGAVRLQLSRATCEALLTEGLSLSLAEAAARVVVVLSHDQRVITAYRAHIPARRQRVLAWRRDDRTRERLCGRPWRALSELRADEG